MASLILKLTSCCILILLLQAHVAQTLRILGIFPLHGKSHFVMPESLMLGLAERGHQVDVYSHFPLKKKIPNYTDFSLAGSIPSLQNNITYGFMQFMGDDISIPKMLDIVGKPVCKLLNLPIFQKLAKEPPRNPPYDLVITELFVANCFLAWGRHLNVPLIGLTTTTPFDWHFDPIGNPVNLATDPSIFLGETAPLSFLNRLKNVLLSNYNTLSFKYHAREQNAIVKKIFGPEMPDIIELQKDISLLLMNYNYALSGIRTFAPAAVPVGGLHVADTGDSLPQNVQKFLDDSKDGFIYVSFGSMVRLETFPKPVLDAFYKTFKRIAPVRVLMKIAKPEELPAGLPSNVMTQTWLSQVKVLKHKNIKLFVTHGGLMGTQESIYFGVPLVGIPLFGDQPSNIDSYVRKNLAVRLNKYEITEQSLFSAVNEVLKNPKYRKSADEIGRKFRDTPMSPLDTAVYWIEYVARHGKDALRSPVVDMPWYQANLLDVYGFIASIILLALLIIKFLVRKLVRLVCPCSSEQTKKKVKKN